MTELYTANNTSKVQLTEYQNQQQAAECTETNEMIVRCRQQISVTLTCGVYISYFTEAITL